MAQMGRPRSFDRDTAIDQALHLFWENGYESTSISQLKAGIAGGISAPSFYAAFGSKETLYLECVDRYLATYAKVTEALWDTSLPPREALEQTLRSSARMQCERGHPKGCMVALGVMSATSVESAAAAAPLARSRARTLAGIKGCIKRGIANGELRDEVDPTVLSIVFNSFLLGLSTLSRDGVHLGAIESAISLVMNNWDSAKTEA